MTAAMGPPRGNPQSRKSTRIFIKILDLTKPTPPKNAIFETVHTKLQGFLTGLREVKNGFNAYSDIQATIDSLTSDKAINEFKKMNLEPQVPPEVRAQRTLFIRQLDYEIGSKPTQDLEQEFAKHQNFLQN